jgi:outer membrane protein OmpA-like peptidoglycan-associated protein
MMNRIGRSSRIAVTTMLSTLMRPVNKSGGSSCLWIVAGNLIVTALLNAALSIPANGQGYGPPPEVQGTRKSVEERNLLDLDVDQIEARINDAAVDSATKGAEWGAVKPPIRFANGSATLTATDVARLSKLAQALQRGSLSGQRISIEGHANATGSRKLNLTLTEQRADNVRAVLIQNYGVESWRLTAHGFGYDRPDQSYHPVDPLQRRAELRVLARYQGEVGGARR